MFFKNDGDDLTSINRNKLKKYLIGMISLLIVLGFILFLMLSLSSCGAVKGSTNPVLDTGIKIIENNYPQDNPIEEKIEDFIETFSGLDVDLSPETPEPLKTNEITNQM
jgi:uncharacterized metal-binding protein